MIRARFKANEDDYRPVNWPVKHPYWCSGSGDGFSIVIAYADDLNEIMENWPEATEIDVEERDEYTFTDRFPKPEWFDENADSSKIKYVINLSDAKGGWCVYEEYKGKARGIKIAGPFQHSEDANAEMERLNEKAK